MYRFILTFILVFLALPIEAYSQKKEQPAKLNNEQKQQKTEKGKFIGFVDKDKNGINDKFYDADGDGKNDVNNKKYPHKFAFKDKNKDKINDVWVDRDGDGVNDLEYKFKRQIQNNIHNNVLDVNEDGRNDITGDEYDKIRFHWKGETWGFWNETEGKLQGKFIDEDGDGIDDRLSNFESFMKGFKQSRGMHDFFIDEDGDGICDQRTDFIGRMGRHGRKGHHSGKKDGKGRN